LPAIDGLIRSGDVYAAQPAFLELAFDSISTPQIPKSHSFIFPCSSINIFEGLTSKEKYFQIELFLTLIPTSMHNPLFFFQKIQCRDCL
jgi:hypothetical protein